MIRASIWTGILFVLILGATASLADVPGLINYQGYLTDPDGYPIGDVLDMQFTLWDDPTDTDPSHLKWTETWDTVTEQVEVSDGYYSVLLGSYQSFGEVFEDNGALWLQVEVDAEVMTSRKRVAAVAYAQSAKSADELTFLITESHIEDGAVTVSKIAVGAVGSSQIADGTILESDLGFTVVTVETDPTVPTNLKDGVAFSELSGTASDEQVPNDVTIDYATAAGTASAAPWTGITSMPAGFSDGTDDEGTADYGTEITYVPYTISSPGNYYLTGNLTGTGTTAITIDADDVTLDLNGFALQGKGAANEYGIYVYDQINVEIRNGTVRGFGGYGIYAYYFATVGVGHRVIDIRARENGGTGIRVKGGTSLVKNCTSYMNGGHGIYIHAGSIVTGNTVYDNDQCGISAYYGTQVTHNVSSCNGTCGFEVSSDSIVAGNKAWYNDGDGFYLGSNSTVRENNASYNGNYSFNSGSENLFDQNVAASNNQSDGGYSNFATCATCTWGTNHDGPLGP